MALAATVPDADMRKQKRKLNALQKSAMELLNELEHEVEAFYAHFMPLCISLPRSQRRWRVVR